MKSLVRREFKWAKGNPVRVITPATDITYDGCHFREVLPGDEVVNEAELPELTADEQVAMDEATDEFKSWLDKRKRIEALNDHDWLQIEQAACGAVSGTSDEWPDLVRAIEKVLDRKLMRQPSSWLRGFCEALVLSR